jgi:GAF domain-containing protein
LALMSYRLRKDVFADAKADGLVQSATRRFGVEQAAIALVGRWTVHFLAAEGTPFRSVPRDISFCAYAIHSRRALIVPDATIDPRFSDNPLVTGAPHVRFYAGAPLIDHHGNCLGTFCLVDSHPRSFSPEEAAELEKLSMSGMQRIDFLGTMSEMMSELAGAMLV